MTGPLWTLITILGPILLIGAIVWAYLRNRGASRANYNRAEEGAKDLRQELEDDPQYRDE
jgi:cbb3-type cytochrome oxidase subunit 3